MRSKTDKLEPLREKMEEYVANGLKLGWLIDRKNRTVSIHRPNRVVELLENAVSLSGEEILPGFVLNLQFLWDNY